jgi:hypothetical protein
MTSAIDSLLKVRYGELINPLPDEQSIADHLPFVQQEMRHGKTYNFPVRVSIPHGVTHDDTNTAFDLAAAVAASHVEAIVPSASILIRDNVAYNDVLATMNGVAAGGNAGSAFMSAWDVCTKGLIMSGNFYRELAMMYGPGPTSTLAATLGVVSTNTNAEVLTNGAVVTISTATFAATIWSMLNGGKVDVYASDLSTLRAAGVTVSAPSENNNRVTLTKAATAYTPVSGDVIVVASAIDVSCYGLQALLANAGTILNISAAANPMWKSLQYAVGGAMTRSKVLGMAARLQNRGLKNGGKLFLSGNAITDLIEEAQENIRFNGGTGDTVKQGAKNVTFTAPCGDIECVPHPYMKQGIGFFLPTGKCKRVGQSDMTMSGFSKNQWDLVPLADKAGVQMRIMGAQAPVIEEPWHAAYLTGISSANDTVPA